VPGFSPALAVEGAAFRGGRLRCYRIACSELKNVILKRSEGSLQDLNCHVPTNVRLRADRSREPGKGIGEQTQNHSSETKGGNNHHQIGYDGFQYRKPHRLVAHRAKKLFEEVRSKDTHDQESGNSRENPRFRQQWQIFL
jgi:hypothetical protein